MYRISMNMLSGLLAIALIAGCSGNTGSSQATAPHDGSAAQATFRQIADGVIVDVGGVAKQVRLEVVGDNAQRRPYYALIPKNAANPNAAILYTVYLSTTEGQALVAKHWGIDLYEYPDSTRRKQLAPFEQKGVKFRDITIDWWAAQKGIDDKVGRMIKAFNAAR